MFNSLAKDPADGGLLEENIAVNCCVAGGSLAAIADARRFAGDRPSSREVV